MFNEVLTLLFHHPTDHNNPRIKGGRPIGTTSNSQQHIDLSEIAAKNEIATLHSKDRKAAGKKRLKRGHLEGIIQSVKKKNKLKDSFAVSKSTIHQRLKNNLIVLNSHPGHTSPLAEIESDVVEVLIQMARLRQCVTPSQAVQLINSMISGTAVQRKLIEWKKKNSFGDTGTIGTKYWTAFKKRNCEKIYTKKGQKYELDRVTWSTYANFEQMYDQIYDMMVEAGVAVKKDYPEWMDAYGDIVYEDNALGCKVTHDLIRPEMCIVMDEVGGNTSQKGDGNKGGEKFIVPKGMIPQLKANAQDKHFTLLGLTTLGGDPVMCVIILLGL